MCMSQGSACDNPKNYMIKQGRGDHHSDAPVLAQVGVGRGGSVASTTLTRQQGQAHLQGLHYVADAIDALGLVIFAWV